MIDHVKLRIAFINDAIESIRPEFESFIKDKGIPLEERWQLFVEANDVLSKTGGYIVHWDSLERHGLEYGNDIYFDKNETQSTVDLVELVETYINEAFDEKPNPENKWYNVDVDELKEEILERNIKSYGYDW